MDFLDDRARDLRHIAEQAELHASVAGKSSSGKPLWQKKADEESVGLIIRRSIQGAQTPPLTGKLQVLV
jgi:hypothetical protein